MTPEKDQKKMQVTKCEKLFQHLYNQWGLMSKNMKDFYRKDINKKRT